MEIFAGASVSRERNDCKPIQGKTTFTGKRRTLVLDLNNYNSKKIPFQQSEMGFIITIF